MERSRALGVGCVLVQAEESTWESKKKEPPLDVTYAWKRREPCRTTNELVDGAGVVLGPDAGIETNGRRS